MFKQILNRNQERFLEIVKKNPAICKRFYLTGGTALAAFYLKHRHSEDLDFFSEEEADLLSVTAFLKANQRKLNIVKFESQTSFNRNIFFLYFNKEKVLKIEFTYFPFKRIERGIRIGNLEIDSLLDIAVNKLFTVYQNPRSRDFIDLYFIMKSKNYDLLNLISRTKMKFDWHIDALNLGSQLVKIESLKDFPKMIKKVDQRSLVEFFKNLSKRLKPEVIKYGV